MADAGNGLQQHQALIIACGGVLFDMPLHLVELLIEQADEVEVEFNAFLSAGMCKAGGDTFAIEPEKSSWTGRIARLWRRMASLLRMATLSCSAIRPWVHIHLHPFDSANLTLE